MSLSQCIPRWIVTSLENIVWCVLMAIMSWFTFFCERLHISSIVWTGGGSEKDIFIIQFHGPISLALKFFTRHSTWIWFKFTVTWNSSQPLIPINLCICHDNTSVTYTRCGTDSLTLKHLFFFKIRFYFQMLLIIPPASTKLKGGYTGITLSVCPSVRLWTESCPLCNFNNTHRIHFIFAHLIRQLKKVCRV